MHLGSPQIVNLSAMILVVRQALVHVRALQVGEAAAVLIHAGAVDNQADDIVNANPSALYARIPAADIIDFDYGPGHSYWHQAADTLDKTSSRSLKVVGDAVYMSLPEIDKRVSQ